MTLPGRRDGKQMGGDVPIVPAPEEGVMGTVAALLPRDGKLDTQEPESRRLGSQARERSRTRALSDRR